jgi:H+-transporting ATPase
MTKTDNEEPANSGRDVTDFQKVKAKEAARLLGANINTGLNQSDVVSRLKFYGYNEVPEKKANPIVRFVKKFWGLTAWKLEFEVCRDA